jgi:hypothetical protein
MCEMKAQQQMRENFLVARAHTTHPWCLPRSPVPATSQAQAATAAAAQWGGRAWLVTPAAAHLAANIPTYAHTM